MRALIHVLIILQKNKIEVDKGLKGVHIIILAMD